MTIRGMRHELRDFDDSVNEWDTPKATIWEHINHFPHLAIDKEPKSPDSIAPYMEAKMTAGECIWEDRVVILYEVTKTKKMMGNAGDKHPIPKGSYFINQIAKNTRALGLERFVDDPQRADKVIKRFFEFAEGPVYLVVRDNNEAAIRFYNRVGMTRLAHIKRFRYGVYLYAHGYNQN